MLFDDTARELWNEVAGITKQQSTNTDGDSNNKRFAENAAKITRITEDTPR